MRCPTLDTFFLGRYLPFARVDKRSWATDERYYRIHIQPTLGRHRMNAIRTSQILDLIQQRREAGLAPATVNRVLILLRYCYNLALQWEVPGVSGNPVKGLKPLGENNLVERYLNAEESQRLDHALADSRNRMLRPFVAFLLLTGARRGEALNARWADIDEQRRIWRVPLAKSGKSRHITLSEEALRLLEQLRLQQTGSNALAPEKAGFVFAKPGSGKPYGSVYDAWNRARRQAGLHELRMHDLRHSFASALVNHGVSLYEVQRLLGHASIKTTERYAHLQQSSLRASAAIAGRVFGHLLT